MLDEIIAIAPRSDWICDALRSVPRHPFIPTRALSVEGYDERETLIDRNTDPTTWWASVYADSTIITQVDDGAGAIELGARKPTSSASAPSTVADLLKWLSPRSGDRVLEVGTGTGWTAALLSYLVGDQGEVTSVEVDPVVAEQAAKNLAAAGVQPRLIVGDGAAGCPDRAPFDGVHVTCGIYRVPYAWVEQTRPGGTIVLPYDCGMGDGHGLRLRVVPGTGAVGRFTGFASYMLMRAQRDADGDSDERYTGETVTRLDPRMIGRASPGARLAMAGLTGLRTRTLVQEGVFWLWVLDPEDPAQYAVVHGRPGDTEYPVYLYGDRPVWEEITDAYFRWVGWGEPGRERFGMTVTPEGQRIWLDSPTQHPQPIHR
ncbi:methyltransferase domain-containing protein [Nonomuraea rosea]